MQSAPFLRHFAYVFFRGIFLAGRTPTLPVALTPEIGSIMSLFRLRVQKYCFYLTCANFWAKKCTFGASLEKNKIRRDAQRTPLQTQQPQSDYASKFGRV